MPTVSNELDANGGASSHPAPVATGAVPGVIGPPSVIFLDANGRELRNLRLIGYEPAHKFLARLRQIPRR